MLVRVSGLWRERSTGYSRKMTMWRAGFGVLVVAVIVSGCQEPGGGALAPGGDPTGATSVSPPVTASSAVPTEMPTTAPTETPTPTVTATPPADAGNYLTSEGYGAFRIGKPIPDDNGLVVWKPDRCGGGAWIPNASLERDEEGINKWTFLALPDPKNSHDGALARILVSDDSIPTKSGVRVGDSLADLKQTYGSFDHEFTSADRKATFFEIDGSVGSVVFMVGGQNYGYTAPDDVISVIGVVAISEDLEYSAARMVQAPCDE